MATGESHTAVGAEDGEAPTQEDAVWEEESCRTPERRLADVLLDISEEDSMREQEPYEYHCYPGAEEAVSEWLLM